MGEWFSLSLRSTVTVALFLICSYSRKIMWLKVATTNNDPKVILLYYLQALLRLKGTLI